ncbi:MAG: hypothetical protein Q9M15_03705 [Mariprofundaceae bacterium]|nr:hypothetical protein [Mariprofundaceae bacterium]
MIKSIVLSIIIVLGGVSCSTESALIHRDDATFAKAQAHFQDIKKVVDNMNLPASESNLFLQAEGFYQYRFTPAKKSNVKYLAEAASAMTDFPGFQALAGSLDVEDLRFRSSDSAVQLWETLLQDYPNTLLKPLTLYQLGWAYRNIGAQGLPRSSPNEAFDELIQDQPHSNLAMLARDAKKVPYKTKEQARFRSLIPGMGQMYLGETQSGFTRLSIAVAGLIAMAVPIYNARYGKKPSLSSLAMGFGGLVVLSFNFTNASEDAIHGVIRWNERAESEFQRQHPAAP